MPTAKAGQLSRADVGAWVFKGNPDVWDYFANLSDSGRPPGDVEDGSWTLGTTYRSALVDEGDLVVLWITGTDSPGIYEIGYINGPIESGVIDTEHLVDEDKRGKTVPVAPFRTALLTEHVPRSDLKADPVLASCEQFRIPVISNPTYLTPQEVQALLAYLRPKDLKAAGWTAARLRKAGVR